MQSSLTDYVASSSRLRKFERITSPVLPVSPAEEAIVASPREPEVPPSSTGKRKLLYALEGDGEDSAIRRSKPRESKYEQLPTDMTPTAEMEEHLAIFLDEHSEQVAKKDKRHASWTAVHKKHDALCLRQNKPTMSFDDFTRIRY